MKKNTQSKPAGKRSFRLFLSQKKVKSTLFTVYLSTVIIGYFIFFLSPLYMPTDFQKYKTTLFNEEMELNPQRKFTLLRWDYSEDQHLMELEMDVDNSDFTSDETLKFSAKTKPSEKVNIKSIVNEDSYLVFQISNIPEDFEQVAFWISLSKSGKLLRLYSNINDIHKVDHIETLTKDEYLYNRLSRNVQTYQKNIKQYQDEIADKKILIEKATTKNAELETNKEYMTNTEIEEVNQKILDNESLISDTEKEIETLNNKISEEQNKIAMTQEHINSLGKGKSIHD